MATNFVDTSDFTGRALLVQGMSSVHVQRQNAEQLTIHFQKRTNRGGDVSIVLYPLDSNRDAAIVVFEDAKDRDSTLLHHHVFYNVSLQVQVLPPLFRSIEVEIDPFYATLLLDVVHHLMRRQGPLRNPSLGRQNTNKFSFSSPSELRYVEEEVYKNIAGQSETAYFASAATGCSYPEQDGITEQEGINYENEVVSDKKRNRDQPEEGDPDVFIRQLTTERDNSVAHAADDKKIEENETSTTDIQVSGPLDQTNYYDDDGSSTQTDSSVVVDKFSYNFLMKYRKAAVEKILKNHSVRITENKMDLLVRATFVACSSKTLKEVIQTAVDEFTVLYQTTVGRLNRKAVECPPSVSKDVLEKAALKTSKVFKSNTLITQVDHNPIYYVILSSNNVEEVAQHFRKEAGIPSKKKLRTANRAPGPENKEIVPEQPTDTSVATNQSMASHGKNKTESLGGSSALHSSQTPGDTFVTNEGMAIFIRMGDITRQHEVHAIVNPTDGALSNSSGASRAIGTAAGPQLKKWCDQFMKNRQGWSLKESECCVSPGYNLSCHSIIHIRPMIGSYKNEQHQMNVLYQTFMTCLFTANKNEVKSLAMPLLGSGAAGVPKKTCADALAHALVDFSCVPSRILSDVYLVNIDSEANMALERSLESAFKKNKSTISGYQRSFTSSVNNGRSAKMSPISKSTYDTKDRPIHHSGQMPTESNMPITHPNADQGYKSTTEKEQSDMKTRFGAGPITEKKPVDITSAISDECPICLSNILDVKVLKCSHRFCKECINESFKQSHMCPVCRAVCAQPKGNQPEGTMPSSTNAYTHLAGYPYAGTIDIYKDRPIHHSGQMPTESNLPIKHPYADQGYKSTTEKEQSDMKTRFGAGSIAEKKPVDITSAISDECPICLSNILDVKVLKCSHRFCKECINESFKQSHKCPVCRAVCAQPKGNQPEGTMTSSTNAYTHLAGYPYAGTIDIYKDRPIHHSGQMPTDSNLPIKHPNADQGYKSTTEKEQSDMKTRFGAGPITEKKPVDITSAISDECPICLSNISDVKVLKCSHRFCKECINESFKQSHMCPVCLAVCAQPKGNQPEGTMTSSTNAYTHLAGYPYAGTIDIYKDRPIHHSGQMPTESSMPITHPNADQGYKSTTEKEQSDMKTRFGAGPITEKKPVDITSAISDECPICLSNILDVKVLKCSHRFCKECINESFKQSHKCPVCLAVCAQPKGNQPEGTMTSSTNAYTHLPGYPYAGTITIYYNIPSGKQTELHPHPNNPFTGATRTAYLPDNQEGRKVLSLLEKAFDAGLVFTVGRSVSSGFNDTVTWNDIHHKTSRTGGPSNFGYPDPGYLKRVKEDLAAFGIV